MSEPVAGRSLDIVCGCGSRLGRAELVAHDARGWWPVDQPPNGGPHARRWAVEHWLVSADTRRDTGRYRDGQVPDDYGDWPVHLRCKACRYDLRIREWRALYPLLDGVAAAPAPQDLTLPLIDAFQRTHPLT